MEPLLTIKLYHVPLYLKLIKCVLFVITVGLCNQLHAQVAVAINGGTVSISPSYTVTDATSYSAFGQVKNTGALAISNNVHVNLGIDTSSTLIPKYYWRSTTTYSVTNFAPGTTFTFEVSDVASSTANYKVGGNGTTVVIWALVGASTGTLGASDSAFTSVYIIGVPASINELLDFENSPIHFKNPIAESIQLNYDETFYTKVELLFLNGQLHSTLIENKTLVIDHLSKGIYLLRFYNSKQKTYITKKLIIE